MRVILPSTEILDDINGKEILQKIERAAKVCYKSESNIREDSAERFVYGLLNRGHEGPLEHVTISIKFICDRGVSHELVRHRLASFCQERTRYCNYSIDKFGKDVTFIKPCYLKEDLENDAWNTWYRSCQFAEAAYFKLLEEGCKPEEARAVLPNSLKTEVVMTANIREWRHFFKLRAAESTGKVHPQMKELTVPLLRELQCRIPVVFEDIIL